VKPFSTLLEVGEIWETGAKRLLSWMTRILQLIIFYNENKIKRIELI
jgi:hypothetical protein